MLIPTSQEMNFFRVKKMIRGANLRTIHRKEPKMTCYRNMLVAAPSDPYRWSRGDFDQTGTACPPVANHRAELSRAWRRILSLSIDIDAVLPSLLQPLAQPLALKCFVMPLDL